ncbi:Hypothetical predicted protein, partial [Pelobates cultripes]
QLLQHLVTDPHYIGTRMTTTLGIHNKPPTPINPQYHNPLEGATNLNKHLEMDVPHLPPILTESKHVYVILHTKFNTRKNTLLMWVKPGELRTSPSQNKIPLPTLDTMGNSPFYRHINSAVRHPPIDDT